MDMFDAYISVPIIAICFVVGYVIKNSTIFGKIPNENIPLICTIIGAIFGLLMIGLTVDGFIIGAVSGLASTGVHQMRTQFCELKSGKEAIGEYDVEECQDDMMELPEVDGGDMDE